MPLKLLARTKAQKYGVDPDMFERQINQESGFNPRAYNPSGASGIAQLMPQFYPNVDPYDPDQALDAAASSVASYRKMYGGDYRKALSAYNYGPGNLNKLVGQYGDAWEQYLPGETKQYLSVIMPGGAPGGVSMARYGNNAPGYRPVTPQEGGPPMKPPSFLDDEDEGKQPPGVWVDPETGERFIYNPNTGGVGSKLAKTPRLGPNGGFITPEYEASERVNEWIGIYNRLPTPKEEWAIRNKLALPDEAEGRATYGPKLYDEYGRPFQVDSNGKIIEMKDPPSAPAGRDLRMSDAESARAGLDREKFGYDQSRDLTADARQASLDAFNERKFTEEDADRDRSFDYGVDKDARAEAAAREKFEADEQYRQATLDYQRSQAEAQAAYNAAQLAVDREYKTALIENARADLEEKRRQFEIAEARARRAQQVAEEQARINNMFEASERTGLISSGILGLGNSAPGYGDKIGILSGFQR